MAQYDITSEVHTLIEAGWTPEQIKALSPSNIVDNGEKFGWVAWNRRGEEAVSSAARKAAPAPEAPAPRTSTIRTDGHKGRCDSCGKVRWVHPAHDMSGIPCTACVMCDDGTLSIA